MRINKLTDYHLNVFNDFYANALADTMLGKNLKINYLILKALIIKCNAEIRTAAINDDATKSKQLMCIGYNLYYLKDKIEQKAVEIDETYN